MPRTIRPTTDSGVFSQTGSTWDYRIVILATSPQPYRIGEIAVSPNTRADVNVWLNGLISFGTVTEAQRQFVANWGVQPVTSFPGDFLYLPGVTGAASVGVGRSDFDAPYNESEAVPLFYVDWLGRQVVFTSQLTNPDFSVFGTSNVVARIGELRIDTAVTPLPEIVSLVVANLSGTAGNDTLVGGVLAYSLLGNDGADLLIGQAAADWLDGGNGSDTLTGGAGADRLTGGAGTDIFRDTAAGLNGDTIADFTSVDRIIISNATLAGFSFNLTGSTLTFTGGALTLTGGFSGTLVASAAMGGGVQLSVAALVTDARNDFNGDGRSDILWRNSSGSMIDWLANANGTFTSNHGVAIYELDTSRIVVGSGDFNGDGRDDLLVRDANGVFTDWLGQANGSFFSNHAIANFALGTNWGVAGTGDFNGDGRDDILWRNEVGAMSQWLGQANGSFAYNAAAAYQLPTIWQAAATGDFNGDGRDDIIWRNNVGALSEWLGQTNGTFVYNGNAAYQLPTNWTLAAAADFNGDGIDDILWRNEVGAMSQWLGQSNGTFAYNPGAAYQLPTNWQLATVGDFNGDGRDDLVWRNEVGAMAQWLANGDGTFAYNPAAAYQLATSWQVQDPGI